MLRIGWIALRPLALPLCWTASVRLSYRPFSAGGVFLRDDKILPDEDSAINLDTKPREERPIYPRTGESQRGSNWNYDAELYALAKRLGYELSEIPSLQTALIHRSALATLQADDPSKLQSNGRLSVLGRGVLAHYVTEYLYFAYPHLRGQMLFDLLYSLTNHNALVKIADHLGVPDLIQSHKLNIDHLKIISHAFTAVIGVIHVEKGPSVVKQIIHDFVIPQMTEEDVQKLIKLQHPKFMLQAIWKGQGKPPPVSRLLQVSRQANRYPSFVVGVYSDNVLLGEGCGTSLKRAEREAIVAALLKHFQSQLTEIPLPSDFLPEHLVNLFAQDEENT